MQDQAGQNAVGSRSLRPGRVLDGRYALQSVLGEGGMAVVWRAEDQRLGRAVAVKFFQREGQDAEEREAFLREARVVAAVKHRHVVDVLDVGEDGDLAYVVMELLRGQSLADLLYETVVGTADALRLTAQILGALGAVHDAGVVHRDLKPENVFLAEDADGVLAKLIDFGVSRFVGNVLGETPGRSLRSVLPTIENRLIGTPEYMSPEQAQALPDVDHRSDLYATGVMLYEMLAGQLPFEAQTRAILLIRVVTDEAPAIERHRPDLAGPLSDFLQQALAKKREERFQDARSMRLALIRAAERLLRGTKREDADSIARAIEAAYEPGDSTLIRLPLQTPRDEVSTEDALAMPPGGGADGADGAAAETEPPRRAALSTGSRAAAEAAAAGFDEQTDWDPVDAEGPDSTQVTLPGRDLRPRAAVAIVLCLLLFTGLALFSRGSGSPAAEPEPAEESAPTEATAAVTSVTLEGVPSGAVVLLDGNEVPASAVPVPEDGRSHALEVRAPGYEVLRQTLREPVASTLRLSLLRLSLQAEAPEAPEEAPAPRTARPRATMATASARTPGMAPAASVMEAPVMTEPVMDVAPMGIVTDPGF